jgi:hypothetical protein
MSMPNECTFRIERTSWNSEDLNYDETEHRLIIYLERSGVSQFDWVGTDKDFEKWTVPDGEPISTSKRQEILDRLFDWGKEHKIRIDIGPSVSMEDMYADYQKKGLDGRIQRGRVDLGQPSSAGSPGEAESSFSQVGAARPVQINRCGSIR